MKLQYCEGLCTLYIKSKRWFTVLNIFIISSKLQNCTVHYCKAVRQIKLATQNGRSQRGNVQ
jgi:hypothetical protein